MEKKREQPMAKSFMQFGVYRKLKEGLRVSNHQGSFKQMTPGGTWVSRGCLKLIHGLPELL